MDKMTSRERVRRAFCFEPTDRVPLDLMEGALWPTLEQWFAEHKGLNGAEAVFNHYDVDFRWYFTMGRPPEGTPPNPKNEFAVPATGSYSDHILERPLRDVRTVAQMLARHDWPDPSWWDFSDIPAFRQRHPDKALVLWLGWMPPFCTACDYFGIEEALVRLAYDDQPLLAFAKRQNEFVVELLKRSCRVAEGVFDICWLGEDLASQRALLMRPDQWRRHFKPLLARQVEIAREHGLFTLFHSCGAVREILPDLIDIGVQALLTFQTSAEGMDAESIARDFGGRIAFYGGVDVQHLLTFGTEDDVRREVRKNIALFARCGGHIVSNSHHYIDNIKPENVAAMLDEALRCPPMA